MPIEIRISDIKSLSIEDIQSINTFLMSSRSSVSSETNTDENKKSVTPQPPSPPRKKQKTQATLELNEPNFKCTQIADDLNTATYEQLVSFVLEAVRENKLEFGHVVNVVRKFGLRTLQDFQSHYEFIDAAYVEFKSLIEKLGVA